MGFTSQNTQPGDYYKAIWCRDAAYILKDQFLSGHYLAVLERLKYIWSRQIGQKPQTILYGRGSPKTGFTPLTAKDDDIKTYKGALPTTIFDNFSEIYALKPDIDSTALMLYISSWAMTQMAKVNFEKKNYGKLPESGILYDMISTMTPFLLNATNFLLSCDTDGDGLLEQDFNEDWMDTVLRKGKTVYSQGCYLLALKNIIILLQLLHRDHEVSELESVVSRLVNSIEAQMWSETSQCYLDINSDTVAEGYSREVLYQDSIFYLLALTEGSPQKIPSNSAEIESDNSFASLITDQIARRMKMTLDSIMKRNWQKQWPLLTDKALERTGPWVLQPNEYHNFTFWPWITAMELITRFRVGMNKGCSTMLTNLIVDEGNNDKIFYEWVNPTTKVEALIRSGPESLLLEWPYLKYYLLDSNNSD